MKPTLGKTHDARIINDRRHPLLIFDVSSIYGPGNLLCFGHLLHPQVRLWVVAKPEAFQVRAVFNDVFVYDPGLLLRQRLEQEEGFTIHTVGTSGKLWRVIKEP